MNSPVDLMTLRPCCLSGPLHGLEAEAANFIRSFAWSGQLLEMYEGFHEPDILGVFLVRLKPAQPQVDEWLWVVVGDLPAAYLVTDNAVTVDEAIEGYVEEMQRWVDAVRAGNSVDDLIPVNTPPTPEFADMLQWRLDVLTENFSNVPRESNAEMAPVDPQGHAAPVKASLIHSHRRRRPA